MINYLVIIMKKYNFLVNINKLQQLITDMTMLEDYKKINFNTHQKVPRLSAPIIITEQDTHCESVMQDFDFPYAIFKTSDNINLDIVDTEPMNLWANETKNIIITSKGGTQIIVPREAKSYIKRELYDYPFISTNSQVDSNILVGFKGNPIPDDVGDKIAVAVTPSRPPLISYFVSVSL